MLSLGTAISGSQPFQGTRADQVFFAGAFEYQDLDSTGGRPEKSTAGNSFVYLYTGGVWGGAWRVERACSLKVGVGHRREEGGGGETKLARVLTLHPSGGTSMSFKRK